MRWEDMDHVLQVCNGDRYNAAKMVGMTQKQVAKMIHNHPELKQKWGLGPQTAEPVEASDEIAQDEAIEVGPKKPEFRVVQEVFVNAGMSVAEANRAHNLWQMANTNHNLEMLKIMGAGMDVNIMAVFTRLAEIQKRLDEKNWIHPVPFGKDGPTGSTLDEERVLLDSYNKLLDTARKISGDRFNNYVAMLDLKLKAEGGGKPKRQKPGFAPLQEDV